MKYFFIFICTICTTVLTAQKPIFVTSKVNEVTLYLNGAELNHTLNVPLQKGTNEIVVKNISNQLDENSIRIKSNKSMTILSASFTNKYYNEFEIDPNSVALQKVQDSILLTTREIAVVRNTIEMERQTIQLLDKNQTAGGTNTGISVLELMKLVDYYRQKRLTSSNNINSLQEKEQKLVKAISRLQNQLTFVEGKEEKISNGKIIIQVMSDVAQTAQFELSYLTTLASWAPFYEIETASIEQPLHLTTKGNVIQRTGIDWKQVKLSLSSTQPNPNNSIPYFSQWVLNLSQPYGNVKTGSALPVMNQSISSGYAEADMKKQTKSRSSADYVVVSEQSLSISFDVAIPYDIYSNGKPHSVALAEQDIPAIYNYYAAPKLNKDVLLIASINDYSQYNLLAGEANVMFEGVYVGKTYLDPSTTKDTLMIALGVDKNVVIKREKIKEKSGNKVFSGSKESAYTFDITVKNNKKTAIKLVLKDQFPISKDKEVLVELTTTDGAQINNEVGTLTWDLQVKPQESKKVRIGYKVKYPKDKVIYNL